MDVMAPELLWIGGCCYRLPNLKEPELESGHQTGLLKTDALEAYCDDEPCYEEGEDEDIEVTKLGRCKLRMPVSKAFYGKLIGHQGATRKRIEEETRCRIIIPRRFQDGDVEIEGDSRRDVLLAKQHIQATIDASRKRMDATHIVSLPAGSEETKANFIRFRARALELLSISEDVFIYAEKMHWTLSNPVLTDNRERQIAIDHFKGLQPILAPIIAGKSLEVELRGIDIMNDDPSETAILFACCDSPLLQEIVDAVAVHMQQLGYSKREESSVKLHVTLMNTRYLMDEENPRAPRITFDSRSILKEMKDFYFGRVTLKTLHLSQLKTGGEEGYYVPSAIIHLHGTL